MITKKIKRCFGDGLGKEFYADYHDKEWGKPVHNDRLLFEMLCLEGAQAGLSWETILKKRKGYKRLFHNFKAKAIVKMTDKDLEELRQDPSIVRNRLKILSVRKNAEAFLEIQKEFGSFDSYLWSYVSHKPLVNRWKDHKEVPAKTELSDLIAKDLKKRGMSFVGSTIIYAFMQAVGLVNDHLTSCSFRKK